MCHWLANTDLFHRCSGDTYLQLWLSPSRVTYLNSSTAIEPFQERYKYIYVCVAMLRVQMQLLSNCSQGIARPEKKAISWRECKYFSRWKNIFKYQFWSHIWKGFFAEYFWRNLWPINVDILMEFSEGFSVLDMLIFQHMSELKAWIF